MRFLCDIIVIMDTLDINRAYKCYCGREAAFSVPAEIIKSLNDPELRNIAVITDRTVSGYYYNRFEDQFLKIGIKPVLIPVECTGSGKSLSAVETIYKYLGDYEFGSHDFLIAFGGGGIIDAAGFAASVFDGGIRLMNVPTTLCAMVEVSVSSKSELYTAGKKYVLSASMPTCAVVADPVFLDTVPKGAKSNGYAGIIRTALLGYPELLEELDHIGDLRIYLNKIYKANSYIEKTNPVLLTLGNELSETIGMFFRFMNYTEGEALALSLLSCLKGERRKLFENYYTTLGLPLKLRDVSGKTINKMLEDKIRRTSGDKIRIVDYRDENGGKWIITDVSKEDALKILIERVASICD